MAAPRFGTNPFTLGVASGDPAPDGVVLWTRLAPDPLATDGSAGMPPRVVPVHWEVAEDEAFGRIVRRGTEPAMPELGHSVHAEVHGLRPSADYFYRFRAGAEISPVGRTSTAPDPRRRTDAVTFALASCQSWAGGRYAAYRTMAQEDLDLVVHVGDYVYEGRDTETLANFRRIHAQYKTSPDLQAAHAAFPFVVTFDDHEIENNWAGGVSQPDGEASNEPARFAALRAAAFQAYYEHLPLRRIARPQGASIRLHRRVGYGDLATFHVLDTRQYRDPQLDPGFPSAPLHPASADPARTFTGTEQERWLFDGLDRSAARWNVLAQQTIMAHFDYDTGPGVAVNHDQWDGYAAARQRVLDFVAQRRPSNPVVVTSDWHSSWVNDLTAVATDPTSAVVATEFVGTSISSGCGWADEVAAAVPHNPQVKFFDGARRGYVRCEVTPQEWRSDYRVVASAADTAAPATTLTSWVVADGRPGAVPA
ncbi:alkaline phosphatase D family protein [Pseudonocardia nigra]|uniref:alkaline phosphatase D family protein n=1 Tax=Pseudonocardia nigra TaxID=1921578 RepID=UPI0027E24F4C|nr:alkaline phosphatase D family protein [Pseudonocardia nigra]